MRFLVLLLTFFGLSFSIPAILIEKEVTTRGKFRESHRKVKHYIAEGYEKEVWEERTTTKGTPVNPLLPFMKEFSKGMPQQEPRTQVQRGEQIIHFKKGNIVVYSIHPERRTYTRKEIDARMLLVGIMGVLDCDRSGKCRSKLEPTNEWKRISGWKARKAVASVNMFGREVPVLHWYTKDSKLLLESDRIRMKNLLTAVEGDPQIAPFINEARRVMNEVNDKLGALVMTETPIGGSVTVEVVKSVKKVDLPENFFQVPKGYQEFKPPFGNQNMYRQK